MEGYLSKPLDLRELIQVVETSAQQSGRRDKSTRTS
jgi:hypothetical protein